MKAKQRDSGRSSRSVLIQRLHKELAASKAACDDLVMQQQQKRLTEQVRLAQAARCCPAVTFEPLSSVYRTARSLQSANNLH